MGTRGPLPSGGSRAQAAPSPSCPGRGPDSIIQLLALPGHTTAPARGVPGRAGLSPTHCGPGLLPRARGLTQFGVRCHGGRGDPRPVVHH